MLKAENEARRLGYTSSIPRFSSLSRDAAFLKKFIAPEAKRGLEGSLRPRFATLASLFNTRKYERASADIVNKRQTKSSLGRKPSLREYIFKKIFLSTTP